MLARHPVVVLVEDDAFVRQTIVFELEDNNFEVIALDGPGAALQLFAEETREIACLLTNIDLGAEIDGFELARRAKALRIEVHVIYITGGAMNRATAEMLPGCRMIEKPFSLAALAAEVKRTVEGPGHETVVCELASA